MSRAAGSSSGAALAVGAALGLGAAAAAALAVALLSGQKGNKCAQYHVTKRHMQTSPTKKCRRY